MQSERSSWAGLQRLPWNTRAINFQSLRDDGVPNERIKPFIEKILEQESFVNASTPDAAYTRQQLGISLSTDKTVAHSSARGSKVAQTLLAYKFVDKWTWARNEFNSDVLHLLPAANTPALASLHCAKLDSWPTVIETGLGLITAGSQTNTPTLQEDNALHRMVMMALGQQRFRGGEKILANFEIAAVHASHMLKGNWDLPESIEEMIPHQDEELQVALSSSRDFRPNRLRAPLHYALCVSPITLLIDKQMWKDDVKRDRLIEFWQGTDGNKPYTIRVIEHLLWQAVFDIADGGVNTRERVLRALNQSLPYLRSATDPGLVKWFSSRAQITGSSDAPITPLHTPGSSTTAEVAAHAAPTAAKINSSPTDFRGTGIEITGETRSPINSSRIISPLVPSGPPREEGATSLADTMPPQGSQTGPPTTLATPATGVPLDATVGQADMDVDPGQGSWTGPPTTLATPATGVPLDAVVGQADMDVDSGFDLQEPSTSLPATGVPLGVTAGEADVDVDSGFHLQEPNTSLNDLARPDAIHSDRSSESPAFALNTATEDTHNTPPILTPLTPRSPSAPQVDTEPAMNPRRSDRRGNNNDDVSKDSQEMALEKERQEQEKLKMVKKKLEKLKADKTRQRKEKRLRQKRQEKKAKEKQAQLDRLAEAEAAEKTKEAPQTGREKSGHGDTASKRDKSGNQTSTTSRRKRVIKVPADFYNHTPRMISANKAMDVTDVCETPSISIIRKQPLVSQPCDIVEGAMTLLFGSGMAPVRYHPRFHREDDLARFTSLFYSSLKSPMNVPLHIAHPPSSAVHIHIPGEQPIHHAFAKRHILLPNFKNSGLIFNKNGLHTITKPSRMIMMEDFSVDPANEKRFICMRADTIIDRVDTGPTLQCRQLPMLLPRVEPPSALATDIRAWYHMEGVFPDNNWRFSFAANKGALGTWKVADAGMCTSFYVAVGAVLLVIGRPIQNDPDLFADPELYLSNWNSRCESSSWDTETVLVEKNCAFQLRPNTPFLTLSIDNSICHLSYFISMQTMPQTLAGVMQIFLKHKILHSSREYMKIHPLLHRIVNYVHDAYVIHGGKDDTTEHLPDFDAENGIYHFLALFALVELANVLHPDTYKPTGVSPPVRLAMIRARANARVTMNWLFSVFTHDSTSDQPFEFVIEFLCQQTNALIHCMESLTDANYPHPHGFTLEALQEQIDMCLQNLPCVRTYQEQCSSRLPSFAWNGEEVRIRRREKPIEIAEMFDVTGYTADDITWLATVA